MNHLLLLFSLLSICSLPLSLSSPLLTTGILTQDESVALFTRWMMQYAKVYEIEQFPLRYNIWNTSFTFINQHNNQFLKGNSTYSVSLNEFADWTLSEIQQHNGLIVPSTAPVSTLLTLASPPVSLDWRLNGAVTPVLNQGTCGACFAFSATGSIEGAWAIKHSQLIPLSQQQIIDCSDVYGNAGCTGGLPDDAFEYVIAKGITSASAYPYIDAQGSCSTKTPLVTIASFVNIAINELSLLAAVNIGPVSVAIEADKPSFQYYSSGVYSDPACGTNLDHAVLIVGYGTDAGVPYWIVKNSWGIAWGEEGYIRMIRNTNECGIAMLTSYPVV